MNKSIPLLLSFLCLSTISSADKILETHTFPSGKLEIRQDKNGHIFHEAELYFSAFSSIGRLKNISSSIRIELTTKEDKSGIFYTERSLSLVIENKGPIPFQTNSVFDSISLISKDGKQYQLDLIELDYKGKIVNPGDSFYFFVRLLDPKIADLFSLGQVDQIVYTLGVQKSKILYKIPQSS